MSMIFFTYRSPTQARAGASALRAEGVPVRLGRTPAGVSSAGCGHSLQVSEDLGAEAAAILRRTGHPYQKSYRVGRDELREVRL